jgi:hypothetical protein
VALRCVEKGGPNRCHFVLRLNIRHHITPETPVGATALANIGKYWQNLASLGESWKIFVMAWREIKTFT